MYVIFCFRILLRYPYSNPLYNHWQNIFEGFGDPTVGFQTSGAGYREIWTRRIRICSQKMPNLSVRAEKKWT